MQTQCIWSCSKYRTSTLQTWLRGEIMLTGSIDVLWRKKLHSLLLEETRRGTLCLYKKTPHPLPTTTTTNFYYSTPIFSSTYQTRRLLERWHYLHNSHIVHVALTVLPLGLAAILAQVDAASNANHFACADALVTGDLYITESVLNYGLARLNHGISDSLHHHSTPLPCSFLLT